MRDYKSLAAGEREDSDPEAERKAMEEEIPIETLPDVGQGSHDRIRRLSPLPSDRTWFMELEKILEGMP